MAIQFKKNIKAEIIGDFNEHLNPDEELGLVNSYEKEEYVDSILPRYENTYKEELSRITLIDDGMTKPEVLIYMLIDKYGAGFVETKNKDYTLSQISYVENHEGGWTLGFNQMPSLLFLQDLKQMMEDDLFFDYGFYGIKIEIDDEIIEYELINVIDEIDFVIKDLQTEGFL